MWVRVYEWCMKEARCIVASQSVKERERKRTEEGKSDCGKSY